MIRILLVALLIAFGAATVQAAPKCAPVSLALSSGSKAFTAAFAPKSSAFRAISANFAGAYAKACAEGLLKKHPLPSRLFLLNAPNANIASFYKSGGRMVLEYPFLADDGKHVPDADELHEAFFCSFHGASEKEQEESGRCLPD